jgi:heavy metal translocating P-type ATPase
MSFSYDDFFAKNLEESENPFLTPSSRKTGKDLSLKISICSAVFLLMSYATLGSQEISSLLLGFVYFLSGTPALVQTIKDVKSSIINIDVLMTLAALLSVCIGAEHEGGLLLVLFAFAEAMEEMVDRKTKSALSHLNSLVPTLAIVVENENTRYQKAVQEISVGTKIFVPVGEIVPLDAKVVEGASFVNISHITGESIPVSKSVGDAVVAGSLLIDSPLTLEVTKPSSQSTLAKIIELITQAQKAKPQIQVFLDQFSGIYAKSIILLSLFFALALPLFGVAFLGTEGSIYRSLAFLIAASPCALIIATPTAYLSSLSTCARNGVLPKGGTTLDSLSRCEYYLFDKTGTLTTGGLSCTRIENHTNYPLETILGIAASLEKNATHPIAHAIVKFAELKNAPQYPSTNVQVIAGKGVKGTVQISGASIDIFIGRSEREHLTEEVVTILKIDGQEAIFHFKDELRPEACKVIEELKKLGRVFMLTGDRREVAQPIGRLLGLEIEEIFADLSPEEKLEKIAELSKLKNCAMTGDGINDGPALVRSSCGIAVGSGLSSQTAIEAADIVLMKNDLNLIPQIVRQAKRTQSIVRQNLTIALTVIAFATTPSLLGLIPLWLAVILHEGGTVVVGLNSLRLLRWK